MRHALFICMTSILKCHDGLGFRWSKTEKKTCPSIRQSEPSRLPTTDSQDEIYNLVIRSRRAVHTKSDTENCHHWHISEYDRYKSQQSTDVRQIWQYKYGLYIHGCNSIIFNNIYRYITNGYVFYLVRHPFIGWHYIWVSTGLYDTTILQIATLR